MIADRAAAHVLVAGAGAAASVTALALLVRGFAVTLLARAARETPAPASVEVFPEHAARLFAELGCAGALRRAGAVVVAGFENGWEDPRVPVRLDGYRIHVDREALARALLDEAGRRGARVVTLDRLPREPAEAAREAAALDAGTPRTPFATVDATGRSACWSRPLERRGRATATLYLGPGSAVARPGRVARIEGGWAYRVDHPSLSTVGVVRGEGAPASLAADVAEALGVAEAGAYATCARRPAHAQWAAEPISGRHLATGDAALAYEPVAGQGLRFALASALAAAAALATLRDGGDARTAEDYYRTFVSAARSRHLRKLDELGGAPAPAPSAAEPFADGERLRFAATTRETALQRGGALAMGEAVVLPDGGLVRWAGAFDLLVLRELAGDGVHAGELCERLGGAGVADQETHALVSWCLREGILARTEPVSSAG